MLQQSPTLPSSTPAAAHLSAQSTKLPVVLGDVRVGVVEAVGVAEDDDKVEIDVVEVCFIMQRA